MNILFVCTGNISRSFLAENLFLHEINKNHIQGINASSAGTGACPGTQADPEMIRFLRKKKISLTEHTSRMISGNDIDRADLILVMETFHYNYILKSWPGSADKVEMLGKYMAASQPDSEIMDPYGRSPFHYSLVQSQIGLAVSNLVKTVSGKK